MLDAQAIEPHAWPGAQVRVLTSVTSTNDIAWAWAEAGSAEGTVVFAEEQVRGRGRFGRTWHCPRARGLLMSVVLRPPGPEVTPAHLTALSALAVAEAVEAEAGLRAELRWPNDVTIGGRKVAGVLVERRGTAAAPCVVGMGLNVNTHREELPEELRRTATSLAIEAGQDFSRERLAAAVLDRLAARYRDALDGRWAVVAAEWRRRAVGLGLSATVETGGQAYQGRLVDLDPLGVLELELAGGERRVFRAEAATLVLSPAERDSPEGQTPS